MGRKRHDKLPGLAELGARLKALRTSAGLSQMKLSSLMGFNPAHGYKYVFKLEKGHVPNPTLRTLQSFLAACGSSWQDIVTVLPAAGQGRPAAAEDANQPKPAAEAKTEAAPTKGKLKVVEKPVAPVCIPRDNRPARVRLKTELLLKRRDQAAAFWSRVEQAELTTADLLHARRVPSSLQRRYFALVRSLCSLLQAYVSAKPALLEQRVQVVLKQAAEQGMDPKLLGEIRDLCRKHLAASPAS